MMCRRTHEVAGTARIAVTAFEVGSGHAPFGHLNFSFVVITCRRILYTRLGKGRLRSRETAVDTELQAAQAKLNELNSQLDSLMSELKVP